MKATKRKEEMRREIIKQTVHKERKNLPNYYDFPRIIKGSYSWKCPHCGFSQHYASSSAVQKIIKTQSGERVLFECNNASCKKLYRP